LRQQQLATPEPATDATATDITAIETPPTTAASPDAPDADIIDIQVASGVVPIVAIENGTAPDLPAGATERRISHAGQEIFSIEIAGDGPPIVLAHGFPRQPAPLRRALSVSRRPPGDRVRLHRLG
jgi:hypothetical protein